MGVIDYQGNERKRNVKGSAKRSQNEIRDELKAEIEGCNCLIRVRQKDTLRFQSQRFTCTNNCTYYYFMKTKQKSQNWNLEANGD